MHLLLILLSLVFAFRFGDWRNYEKYHRTLLFLPFVNLVYLYLFAENLLWQFKSPSISSGIIELSYTFICYPAVILLYLSKMPSTTKKKAFYMAKWILIFIVIEYILLLTGRIVFYDNWNIWYSLGFYALMFPTIYLNYKKPLYSYLVILVGAIIAMTFFRVQI